MRKLECWIRQTTMLNRETNNVKSTIGVEKLETCWIADVSTNCKTTTSNAKNTSKIQKLNFGAHWTPYYLYTLLYQTNTFHVAVRLFSNRLQKKSNCGKNSTDTLCFHLVWHFFDAFCDLLLNGHMATSNLLVLYSNETKQNFNMFASVLQWTISTATLCLYFQSKWNIIYHQNNK